MNLLQFLFLLKVAKRTGRVRVDTDKARCPGGYWSKVSDAIVVENAINGDDRLSKAFWKAKKEPTK